MIDIASCNATLYAASWAVVYGIINERWTSIDFFTAIVKLLVAMLSCLIDQNALTTALQTGHVAAAALDVFNPEPIAADHPLLKMDNVIVASHIASTSVPAVKKLRETAARLALMAINGEPLVNVVN